MRATAAFALALAAIMAGTPAAHGATPGLDAPTWAEEFDGAELSKANWSYRATGSRWDGELTPDAVAVADGALTIKTYTEGGKHYSGMISTQSRGPRGFQQRYGYWEARVKFASAPGQWSAFWLQSPTIGSPLGDPATAGVETDIVEHRARCVSPAAPAPADPCGPDADISDRAQQALIWDGYGDDRQASVKLSDKLPKLGDGGWHTWALSWSSTALTFYYDGAPIWSQTGPISRRSQYIILSSEVAEFFAGDIPEAGYGSRETTATTMQVDYVRVWDTPKEVIAPPVSAPVVAPVVVAPVNTGVPTVSGMPAVGRQLTCSTGSWSGGAERTLAYEWLSDGAPIRGASASSRAVQSADRGHALACRVTATNAAGSASATSRALMVPAAPKKVAPTLFLSIRCSFVACRARAVRADARATVRVPRTARWRARTYMLKARATTSPNGRRVTTKLELSRSMRRAIVRALIARKPIAVRVGIRVTDSAGHTRTLGRAISLKL